MLKRAVRTIGLILVIFLLGGGIAMFSFGGKVNVNTDKSVPGVSTEICDVLYYGGLAASSHNTQCWQVAVDEANRELLINVDRDRQLLFADAEGRELYISLGCYVENLLQAFEAYGYSTAINYLPDEDKQNIVVHIRYTKNNGDAVNQEIIETIKRRHADKSEFNSKAIDSEVVKALLEDEHMTSISSSARVMYFANKSDGNEMQKYADSIKSISLAAMNRQCQEDAYRQELSSWLRFSNKEVDEKQDGISAEMMGMSGIIKAIYYLGFNHEKAMGDSFANQGIALAEKQLDNCSGFFVVTSEDNPAGWINAGRRTQHLWYHCTEYFIAMQPFSAALELQDTRQSLQQQIETGRPLQMILRAGYVDNYGENQKVRRDLKEYVKAK